MEEMILLSPAYVAYGASTYLYQRFLTMKSRRAGQWATYLLLLGLVVHSLAIGVRWQQAGRLPMANLFEAFALFTWLLLVIYLVIEMGSRQRALGAFVVPVALLLLIGTFFLPREIAPNPLLQNGWFAVHVGLFLVAYSSLTLGAAASGVYLLQERGLKSKNKKSLLYRLPPLESTEHLGHRFVQLGFPFLVAGGIAAAMWANEAWGTYWVWEPKQVTVLFDLAIYALYFYTRYFLGWRGRRGAWMIIAGFAAIMVSFVGVGLLGVGAHAFV